MIHNKVDEKDHDYPTLPSENFIRIIGTFEARDDRRHADFEEQNYSSKIKKKKFDQSEEAESNRKVRPRAPCKKNNPNPGKRKQKKTASNCGIQR